MIDPSNVHEGDRLRIIDDLRIDNSKYIIGVMLQFAGTTGTVLKVGKDFVPEETFVRLKTGDFTFVWHPSVLEYVHEDNEELGDVNIDDLWRLYD